MATHTDYFLGRKYHGEFAIKSIFRKTQYILTSHMKTKTKLANSKTPSITNEIQEYKESINHTPQ